MAERGDVALLRRVRKFGDPWAAFLGLSQQWIIHFDLADLPDQACAGQVFLHYPYKQAAIKLSRHYVKAASDREVEILVVHELAHVILETVYGPVKQMVGEETEVGEKINDCLETLADTLTRLFLRLRSDKHGGPTYGS